jgi:hypothetical protein
VLPDGGHGAHEAIGRQTRPPDELVTAADLGRQVDWLWLVDGSTAPEPTALERLLEALELLGSLTPPVLLASKVVTPDGSPDPGSLPIPQILDSDLAVAACERHLLSIRVARRGSLLVHRRGLPHAGPERALEWTARLLRDAPGFLVPQSVAVRSPVRRSDVGALLRLVLSDALAPREKPWFAGRLAETALAALTGRSATEARR